MELHELTRCRCKNLLWTADDVEVCGECNGYFKGKLASKANREAAYSVEE